MPTNNIDYNTHMFEESLHSVLAGLGLMAATSMADPAAATSMADPAAATSMADPAPAYDKIYNQAASHIMKNESLPRDPCRIYQDNKGNPTIGRGHLVTNNTRNIFNTLFGDKINFDSIRSGEDKLSLEQINKLFEYDLKRKIALAQRLVPDLFSLPDEIQIAIIDGVYRGDLSGSPKTLKLINARNFKEAAREYLDNKEYREAKKEKTGVAKRMEANARIYSKYADGKQSTPSVPAQSTTNTTKQYIIKPDDTLWKISRKLNTTVEDLQKKNPRVDPYKLQIGQKVNY